MGRPDAVFDTDARQMGDVVVVSVTGELDMASAAALYRAVDRAQDRGQIVVDLRDLTFIDSTGIRALIEVYSAGQNGHSTVSFIRGQAHVQRVLQMAGVEGLLAWVSYPTKRRLKRRSLRVRPAIRQDSGVVRMS